MERVSALLALYEGNPPVTGGFPSQRASNASFGVFFDVSLNKMLNKQSSCRRFETPGRSLWRHCNPFSGECCLLGRIFKRIVIGLPHWNGAISGWKGNWLKFTKQRAMNHWNLGRSHRKISAAILMVSELPEHTRNKQDCFPQKEARVCVSNAFVIEDS